VLFRSAAAFALLKAINSSPAATPLPDPLPAPPPVPLSYLVALKDRIQSPSPLSAQEQNLLFLEIEGAIDKGRSPGEIQELLHSLKQRDDLLASVGRKVDEALKRVYVPERRPIKPQPPAWRGMPMPAPAVATTRVDDRDLALSTNTCPHCQKRVEPDWRFCLSCGNALAPAPAGVEVGKIPGSKLRRFACPPDVIPRIIGDVRGWLNQQDFDTQQIDADHNSATANQEARRLA
jgi:hypothetical protein